MMGNMIDIKLDEMETSIKRPLGKKMKRKGITEQKEKVSEDNIWIRR